MKLSKLLDGIGDWKQGMPDPEIAKICYDSRQVGKDDLYVALIGAKLDGIRTSIRRAKGAQWRSSTAGPTTYLKG